MPSCKQLETILEDALFNSRWLLVPFYVGLVLSLLLLLVAFIGDLIHFVPGIFSASPTQIILAALTLIDLTLAGNLVVIMIFSGYENFVSKIETGANEDRPVWMGTLNFSRLKMKLIGSIVAMSAISLLGAFMKVIETGVAFDEVRMRWLVVLHLTFVVSGLLFALMDWIAAQIENH